MTERWLPIRGFEDCYLVSDHGRVYSLPRIVDYGDGRAPRRGGLFLKPFKVGPGRGHLAVRLCRAGRGRRLYRVHNLVAAAFIGDCPDGLEVLHWDDDSSNNRLTNLRYGTRSENCLDLVRNGRHYKASRTHCPNNHEFTPENTYIPPGKRERHCRECRRQTARRSIQVTA